MSYENFYGKVITDQVTIKPHCSEIDFDFTSTIDLFPLNPCISSTLCPIIVFNATKMRRIKFVYSRHTKEERIEVKNSALSARAAGESG